jgi:hypothetical protein
MTSPLDNPSFRRWFGDSKVVDAHGEPMVVYHGTGRPLFSAFQPVIHDDESLNQIPFGIHFAEDVEQAIVHTESQDPRVVDEAFAALDAAEARAAIRLGYESAGRLYVRAGHDKGSKKYAADLKVVRAAGEKAKLKVLIRLAGGDFRRVIPVYLSIQRPLDARVALKRGTPQLAMAKRMMGDRWDAFVEGKQRRVKQGKVTLLQDAIDKAPARVSFPLIVGAGYDGVLHMAHYRAGDYRTWVAFDPRQIKHATENVGTYDPSDPSMYKNPRSKTSRRPR